jgi:23S rRNA pseudouridine1911/1915/1917 synthase
VIWVLQAGDDGRRMDEVVAERLGISHAKAKRILDAGQVRVDGARVKKGARARAGQRVTVEDAATASPAAQPQPELDLDVLYEDDAIVAVSKPAGQPTHPLRAGEQGSTANAIVARFPECARSSDDRREGGVAHRLDVDTSGVLLAARSPEMWRALRQAFSSHRVIKRYLAVVASSDEHTPPDSGTIDAPLSQRGRRKMTTAMTRKRAQDAESRFTVLARSRGLALVRVETSSGRMHQVRAHLASIGCPLYGDALYGGPASADGRHLLHAESIELEHPRTQAPLRIDAPWPRARLELLRSLGLAD